MTVSFTSGNNAVSVAPADLILSAMLEAAILGAGDKMSALEASWGLEKLQRLIDSYNAIREIIFNVGFNLFTMQASHNPHTIGPAGDFVTPIRPVKIVSASFILNSSGFPTDAPINIRDNQWYAALPNKSLSTSISTDLYYDPAGPLGNCNFYPICNIANPVRLEFWNSLPQAIDLVTQLGFVQGYWDLIVYNLAVRLCPSFGKEPSQALVAMAKESLSAIVVNNNEPPRIDTDNGTPSSGRIGRPDFNFLTGLRE